MVSCLQARRARRPGNRRRRSESAPHLFDTAGEAQPRSAKQEVPPPGDGAPPDVRSGRQQRQPGRAGEPSGRSVCSKPQPHDRAHRELPRRGFPLVTQTPVTLLVPNKDIRVRACRRRRSHWRSPSSRAAITSPSEPLDWPNHGPDWQRCPETGVIYILRHDKRGRGRIRTCDPGVMSPVL